MEQTTKIPKIIHYCWFGGKAKPEIVLRCIESWKQTCPGFEIKEWTEANYDFKSAAFPARMYEEKKWAFVADYARIDILLKEGGIYLDTDMELVKDLSPLLNHDLLLGEEEPGIISAGMIGTVPQSPFIAACKVKYDTITGLPPTIPRLLTEVYGNFEQQKQNMDIHICAPIAFYPYSQRTIAQYKKAHLTPETYGVHLWNYSWGHPVLRFLNSFALYHWGKSFLDTLGLKKFIKKCLKLS